MSFGVLGKRGAGLADHYGVDPTEVDIMVSSMANALASSGGFCAASKEVVDHQVWISYFFTLIFYTSVFRVQPIAFPLHYHQCLPSQRVKPF